MPLRTIIFLALSLPLHVACGEGGNPGILDSAALDTSLMPTDSTLPMPDSSDPRCPAGQHLCGAGCVDDLANEPANGCRLGCGEMCRTPLAGVASCSAMGTCDFSCEPPATRDGDTCACTPQTCEGQGFTCGEQTDTCGTTLDCGTCSGGSTCGADGSCACTPDVAETNESRAEAYSLGTYDDSAGTMMTFDAFALSADDDEDWFVADIVDGTDIGFETNPDITIRLYGIPAGANFDLAVWFVCNTSTEDVTCNPGTPDAMIGAGCTSSATGSADENVRLETNCTGITTIDDSGTAYIRVTSTTWDNSCAPYSLDITVD